MNPTRHHGAISTMVIFNILLAVGIAAAIYILVTRLEQPEIAVSATPAAKIPPSSPPAQPSAPEVTSEATTEELDRLKKQLESEPDKLAKLREEEKLAQSFLQKNSNAATANTLALPTQTESENSSAQAGLITPMGFPDKPPSF